jgi:uncharacterized protein YdaU (DUF1376 family)
MAKAKGLPWFPLYPADLLSSPAVLLMTDEQLGKFVRILCALYMNGSGKAAAADVQRWARCTDAEWAVHGEALARAFSRRSGGAWFQKRVAAEIRAARNRFQKAVKAGRASAKKRWPQVQQRVGLR